MAGCPTAVLWDMDGTLVDTEPYWIATEFELAERHGGTWSEAHALNLVGNDLLESGALHPRAHGHRPRRPSEIVEELLDGVVAQGRGGRAVATRRASSCSTGLRAAGIPCALVTMSYDRFVAPILAPAAAGDVPTWS